MTWQEIYKKYKTSKLMKEFYLWLLKEYGVIYNIKGVWGYLICFAETKEKILNLTYWEDEHQWHWDVLDLQSPSCSFGGSREFDKNTLEQAMLWCADKFFEVA